MRDEENIVDVAMSHIPTQWASSVSCGRASWQHVAEPHDNMWLSIVKTYDQA